MRHNAERPAEAMQTMRTVRLNLGTPFATLLGVAMIVGAPGAFAATDPVATTRMTLQRAARQAELQAKPGPIARAAFLRQPTIVDMQLAPDGRHLSFLRRADDLRVAVWLQEVASGKQHRIANDVRAVELDWSGDGRSLWLADEQGLAVVDAATRASKRILQWDRRRSQRLWQVDPRTPQQAIVQEHVPADVKAPYRYLLVDTNGEQTLLHAARWPLRGAALDADGRLAYAAAYDSDRYDTVIRRYNKDGADELLRCAGIEHCELVGFDPAQQSLWLLAQQGVDRMSLRRWRASNARWETVHEDPSGIADADGLLWDPVAGDWRAVAYQPNRRHWSGRTAAIDAQLRVLQGRLPNANLDLVSSHDGQLWLVRATQSDWEFDRHYLYRPGSDRLQPVFAPAMQAQQALAPEQLAQAQPISWRASDGMLLHGYLYLPRGVAAAKAPLIAWIHGGPIARVDDRFDQRIQLLVNRGYAVFMPNFRASIGYGLRYTRAAKGDVGHGRVLADIIDGLDFLLAQGIGHRERQAVIGHSFGGYASLLAVSHHPDRFRFAFAGAPPTDYGWIKQWQAEHDSDSLRTSAAPLSLQFVWHSMNYLDPIWRRKMQRESPLVAVANLRTPIYLWAGANDDHVPLKSIAHYAGEANRLGKSLTLLIDPDADHAPRQALDSEGWLYLMERAADRHFGGGTTPPSPELQNYLRKNLRIDTQRLLDPTPVGAAK